MPRAAKRDALAQYHTRRRFDQTPEPRGAAVQTKPGHAYLIQKHDATRLHYDFRLELDGVLLSWAVTRGPSYRTTDRRLAVRTEDHPLEYGGFEGTIPKGNYGGGTVMLWDTGSWEPIGDPREGLQKGKLVFLLHGTRLQGRWGLIRMRPRDQDKRENWLLIKEKDEYANTRLDLLDTALTSVVSRRDLRQIAQSHDREWEAATHSLPAFTPPMLAILAEEVPVGPDCVYEIKFDGYRAQIAAHEGRVKIHTRSGLDWTEKFPAIAKAVSAMRLNGALMDGEIVVLDEAGRSDFPALLAALDSGKGQLRYFAFDLLEHAGENLAGQPFSARKRALKKMLGRIAKNAVVQYSQDFAAPGRGAGAKLLQAVRAQGLEGIIAKRNTAPYRAGRGSAWVKIKCRQEQEFVVIGFSASDKSRPFSSLLMGVNEADGLRYAGRVGTGFDEATLDRLALLRDRHKTAKAPAPDIPREMRRGVTWVKPVLVANIAFAGWTADRQIRQGSFLGLRADKKPAEVVREIPKKVNAMTERIDGVTISHGDKIVYAGAGITKSEIAAYLSAAGKLMLPFAKGRFMTLLRAPDGADHKTFYQRHPGPGFGAAWLAQEFINKNDKSEDYVYFEKSQALVAASQMNVLEFHIWGSRVDRVEQPDRIVFDLDPDPGLDFEAVKRAALRLRDVLGALDLDSLPLLTGGKGVHVVVPIARKFAWPVIKEFAASLADRLVSDAPDFYVATMSKARRKNRIFIDHFRNEIAATAIAPFSPRARPGAPVAWPLDWAGLQQAQAANAFSLRDAAAAIASGKAGAWAGYCEIKQALKPAALRALGVSQP